MRLSGRSALLQSAVCLLLLALSLFLESGTNLDMLLQRRWFDAAAGAWLIDPAAHQVLRVFFYDGMKRAVACIGLGCAALFLWGYASGRSAWMRAGLLMALSCAATPLLVAALTAFTGIHCPRELIEFGGAFPYRHFFPSGPGLLAAAASPAGMPPAALPSPWCSSAFPAAENVRRRFLPPLPQAGSWAFIRCCAANTFFPIPW